MKMVSEICIGEIVLPTKEFLEPSTTNTFGQLVFPMNTIDGPGTYNTGNGASFNPKPLTNTSAMPNFMGAYAQGQRYAHALATYSSIAITITMSLPDFYRSADATPLYTATYDDVYYFCLVPFNSGFNTEFGIAGLAPMPWAQVIRQPGARRCTVHGKGRNSATLRAATSIGKIEGTPSWETDPKYRSTSESGFWSEPDNVPFWMLYAYYPYSGWGSAAPTFEVRVKMGMHCTFFQPKIATLYQALQPGESKVMVSDVTDPSPDDDDTKDEADDDDPSMLDMKEFQISEPVESKTPMAAPASPARPAAPVSASPSRPASTLVRSHAVAGGLLRRSA